MRMNEFTIKYLNKNNKRGWKILSERILVYPTERKPLEQLAQETGVVRERIRQQEAKIMDMLQKEIKRHIEEK